MGKKEKWRALQNGSDIRGIAMGDEINLTDEVVRKIAYGFVCWLRRSLGTEELKIAIGYDGRLTGEHIKKELIRVFTHEGIAVTDVGIATTPALFMSTQYEDYQMDGAIEITASHLPKEYNGFKFFTAKGGLNHGDIAEILDYASEVDQLDAKEIDEDQLSRRDLLADYAKDLRQKIIAETSSIGLKDKDKPLAGRHIVVDAGNGAGGFFATEVLEKLGADITGSQFLEVDGHFPNHIPNPDNKEAMASLAIATKSHQADMGIIFDTDVDRGAVMDSSGRRISRNNLIGLASAIALADSPGGVIVTNSPVSKHVMDFVKEKGGSVEPYISGYRNVINRCQILNKKGINSPLAIETSGHAAFRENYYLDDGAYLIAKILIADTKCRAQDKEFTDLIDGLKEPAETEEIRFVLLANKYQEQGQQIIKDMLYFGQTIADFELVPENREGVRFNVHGEYGEGWFLLRMSLHEPKLVLQIENDQSGKISQVKETLIPFFGQFDYLDRSNLKP